MMTGLYYTLLVAFVLVAFILCVAVLLQEGKGTSLGASFGGDAQDSLFGTATSAVLKKFTAYVAAIFLVVSFILSVWTANLSRNSYVVPADSEMTVDETSGAPAGE